MKKKLQFIVDEHNKKQDMFLIINHYKNEKYGLRIILMEIDRYDKLRLSGIMPAADSENTFDIGFYEWLLNPKYKVLKNLFKQDTIKRFIIWRQILCVIISYIEKEKSSEQIIDYLYKELKGN